ncbi:MAG TPA: serine/threonine-protein kinase, partial [Bacteroidota bacterium]
MIGQTISHYRILEEVGRGGMGIVYKAEDILLHRPVALKFLPAELTRDIEARERFAAEAQAASALDHPNIAVVHEIAETEDGSSFICMAYYEGKTLKEMVGKGPLPLDQTIDIAIQLAEGLKRAHEVGIIHRDLKPANVIVTDRGEVKIVDFGLAKLLGGAKLTTTGKTLGTAAYMSPEQARGEHVDSRTDIWSLGVLLFEMLTGQRPFRSEYEQAVIYAILNEEPTAPSTLRADTPSELEAVVKKCLQKETRKRFQTADELLYELKRSRAQHATRGPVVRRAMSFARRAVPSRPTSFVIPFAAVVVGLLALMLLVPSVTTTIEDWIGVDAIPEQKNLAVLPFTNIGGSPTN